MISRLRIIENIEIVSLFLIFLLSDTATQIFLKMGATHLGDLSFSDCVGENKNKPLVGLITFSDLKYINKQKLEGTVLDPETGKTYKCELTPLKNNKIKLHVIVNRILSENRYLSQLKK